MSVPKRLVDISIKNLTRVLCQVDDRSLTRVPSKGPLILVANHINFLEVPLIYTHLMPRPLTGFAKAETWDNPAMAVLFNLWKAIPLRRGEVDLEAMRQALDVLKDGGILAVAPEGTRSGDGRLRRGHPGVVFLAEMSGAPLLPIVYYGGERFRENIKRLRRTDFQIIVGHLFKIQFPVDKPSRQVRQQITDEIMYQLAALLPSTYRGYYSDLNAATQNFLIFESPAHSNLLDVKSS
jgi:1-acyl-sn-glycerol-3-phosphate acyltransferase